MALKDRGKNLGIIGHVKWSDGTPASHIIVELEEQDILFNDTLPSGKTDLDGNFVISYHPEEYGAVFAEKPDIRITFKYLDEKMREKIKETFFKDITDEWLKIDFKIDDKPIPQPKQIQVETGAIYTTVNLKNEINVDDVHANDLWQIYVGTSTAFSRDRKYEQLKLSSWGGRIVVGDVLKDGPLTRDEKNLTPNGMSLLMKRKEIPKALELKFQWLDKNEKIIHDLIINSEEQNTLSEKQLRILPLALTTKIIDQACLPAATLKILAKITIKNVTFDYEVVCLEDIESLKSIIDMGPC